MGKTSQAVGIRRVLPVLGFVLGLCIVAYPVVLDIMSSMRVRDLESTLAERSGTDEAREFYRVQARAYNDRLAGLDYVEPEGGIIAYDDQLSWQGKPYMSYLRVPKSHIDMPIYHGTAEPELAMGAGHLEGTSLPVGGERSTCVLEGHSGMMTSRMFDDVRVLEEGDVVGVWTLAEPYEYKVVSVDVVMPSDVAGLASVTDGDRLLLVTCTSAPDTFAPRGRVGVNDRRLVVVAERVPYDSADFGEATNVVLDSMSSPRSVPFVAALAMVAAFFLLGFLRRRVFVVFSSGNR